MIAYSNSSAKARNTKYSIRQPIPMLLLIFHLKEAIMMMRRMSMTKRRTMAQKRPSLCTK